MFLAKLFTIPSTSTKRPISSGTTPSDRARKISTSQRTRLKRLMNHLAGISLRKVARKFSVHRKTIQRELNRMQIQYCKKRKTPRYTTKQFEEVPIHAGGLYCTLTRSDFELIMNDENVFTLLSELLSNNREFYTTDPDISPPEVKFKRTQKYSVKVMV
jgi:hypothetical protein